MGTVGHGHQLYLGYGEETTYGTAVARTNYLDVNSESIKDSHTLVESGALNSIGIDTDRVAKGSVAFAGDIVFDAMYGGWERILRGLSGSVGYAFTTNGQATGVHRHRFTPDPDLDKFFTLELFRDTNDFAGADANQAFIYKGCKVNSMTFDASLDSFVQVTTNIVAQDMARAAKSTPTLPTENLVVFTEGAVTLDGSSYNVESFNLTVNNGLNTSKRRVGSRTIFEPTRNAKIEVTGSITLDFESFARYDKFINGTAFAIVLTCTGAAVGSGNEKMVFTLNKCRLTDWGAPVSGPGQIQETFSFKAYRDTGISEYQIDLENDNTTIV